MFAGNGLELVSEFLSSYDLSSEDIDQLQSLLDDLKKQKSNGSWEDSYGEEFATAVAVLILEIPVQYLPVFQR